MRPAKGSFRLRLGLCGNLGSLRLYPSAYFLQHLFVRLRNVIGGHLKHHRIRVDLNVGRRNVLLALFTLISLAKRRSRAIYTLQVEYEGVAMTCLKSVKRRMQGLYQALKWKIEISSLPQGWNFPLLVSFQKGKARKGVRARLSKRASKLLTFQ